MHKSNLIVCINQNFCHMADGIRIQFLRDYNNFQTRNISCLGNKLAINQEKSRIRTNLCDNDNFP